MTQTPVQANVVLTADNSQYDQAMNVSAASTDQLGQSVDTLGQKIDRLTKSGGKKMMLVSAGDVALITGAVAAWNSYEQTVSRLSAQSAILSHNQVQQTNVMNTYRGAVNNLRSTFGTTTQEAANLVETLAKVTSLNQTRDIQGLAQTFTKMSEATGESSEGLASSLTNLQKVMGVPINQQTTKKYADTFTYLAAQTNTSAQGLIDFTAQLAPVGRAVGLNTQQVAGWATAFAKGGQEGIAASSVFTKIATDISNSMATGSPEIAHYANLVGMTQEKFKKLGAETQILDVLEALQAKGKGAASEIDRLGLNGTRSLQAINTLLNEQGGLRQTLNLPQDPHARGAVDRGSAAATMHNLSDEFGIFRQNMQQAAEGMATILGPAVEGLLKGLDKMSAILDKIVNGPMGKFAQMMMGIVGILSSGAGMALLFGAALLKLATAFTMLRSSGSYGLREGLTGAATSRIVKDPVTGAWGPAPGGTLGPRGEELAASPKTSWFMRGMYNAGVVGGGVLGRGARGVLGTDIGQAWYGAREAVSAKIPWTMNYQRPVGTAVDEYGYPASLGYGRGRSMLSYAAGGAGRFIQNFVTPTFDQMRFRNATERTIWAGNEAPWSGFMQRTRLAAQMGDVATGQSQLTQIRKAELQVRQDPMLTNAERQARLDNIATLKREAKERLNSAQYMERSTREEINQAQPLIQAKADETVGTQRLSTALKDLGVQVGGSIFGKEGAIATGMKAMPKLLGTQAGMMGLGMVGATGLSAMGVQNNALMFGSMGLMTGNPYIAAAMAGTGVLVDSYNQYKQGQSTIAAYNQAWQKGAPTDIQQATMDLQKQYQANEALRAPGSLLTKIPVVGGPLTQGLGYLGPIGQALSFSPSQIYQGGTQGLGDIIHGHLPGYTANQTANKYYESQQNQQNLVGAISAISSQAGTPLKGFNFKSDTDWQKLDTIVSNLQPAMDKLHVTTDDIVKAWTNADTEKGRQNWVKLMNELVDPLKAGKVYPSLLAHGGTGAIMQQDYMSRQSEQFQSNVGDFYQATQDIFRTAQEQGSGYLKILKQAEMAQYRIGDENSRAFDLQLAVAQQAQQGLALKAPLMSRAQQFQQNIQQGEIWSSIPITSKTTQTQLNAIQQGKQTTAQGFVDMAQYFQQLLLNQQAYDRQRRRMQDDYALQQKYQQEDYNLQRTREEEDYQLQRSRAIQDYNIQVSQANYDFNLQRKRSEEDYQHSILVMAEQSAQQQMDIYQRVQVQQTYSASWQVSNAADQLQVLKNQHQDLAKLRAEGLTNVAIQQLKLSDPANAQQLERDVVEFTPKIIRQMNQVAGTERVKLFKQNMMDPGNLQTKEMQYEHNKQMARSLTDFHTQMGRLHDEMQRMLARMAQDNMTMLDRQAEDYATMEGRQATAMQTQLNRMASDLAHQADQITGSLKSIYTQAATDLTGSAGQLGQIVLDQFTHVSNSTKPGAIKLMQDLSAILQVPWKIPAGISNSYSFQNRGTQDMSQHGYGGHSTIGSFEGGVLPGYTPGRDVHHFQGEGGNSLHLSGGEGIMRPEWVRAVGGAAAIEAMNHAAKYGGFATGGVYRPINVPVSRGIHDTNVGFGAALDFAASVGHPVYAVSTGNITQSRDIAGPLPTDQFHDPQYGPYGSYGRVMYLKLDIGPEVLYAHLSKRGFNSGARVLGGQAIGLSGSSGNSSGPHLHFGDNDGNPYEFVVNNDSNQEFHGKGVSGDTIAAATTLDRQTLRRKLMARLQTYYERAEKAAMNMAGARPMAHHGDISSIINRMAKQYIRTMVTRYGTAGGGDGQHVAAAPGDPKGNVALGQSMAAMAPYNWTGTQWDALYQLWEHESGWRTNADNPTSPAYGIPQSDPGSKMSAAGADWATNPATQIAWGLNYIQAVYNNPAHAWSLWQSRNPHWYQNGALFDKPNMIGVGEHGPEAVIPLNDRGASFMSDVMAHTMGGRNVAAMRGGCTHVYATRVDQSTNFTGAITVQANNPQELINQLKARQRVMALSRPALTGSAA